MPVSPGFGKVLLGDGRKKRVAAILIRQDRGVYSPINPDLRVIPKHPSFVLGIVKIVTFVKELGSFTQNHITMGEPGRHINLASVSRGKPGAFPFTEISGVRPDVNDNVKHFSLDYSAQFRLGAFYLIV